MVVLSHSMKELQTIKQVTETKSSGKQPSPRKSNDEKLKPLFTSFNPKDDVAPEPDQESPVPQDAPKNPVE